MIQNYITSIESLFKDIANIEAIDQTVKKPTTLAEYIKSEILSFDKRSIEAVADYKKRGLAIDELKSHHSQQKKELEIKINELPKLAEEALKKFRSSEAVSYFYGHTQTARLPKKDKFFDPSTQGQTSYISIGHFKLEKTFFKNTNFEQKISEEIQIIIPFFNEINSNILIKYSTKENKALAFANALVYRCVAGVSAGGIQLHIIETQKQGDKFLGILDLDKRLLDVVSHRKNVSKKIEEIINKIILLKTDYLRGTYKNLGDYNNSNEIKQRYELLVISDFPQNFEYNEMLELLLIFDNANKVGINIIMLLDEEKIEKDYKQDSDKISRLRELLSDIEKHSYVFHFRNETIQFPDKLRKIFIQENVITDIIDPQTIRQSVIQLNKQYEKNLKKIIKVPVADYLPSEETIWKGYNGNDSSSESVKIPIGTVQGSNELQIVEFSQQISTVGAPHGILEGTTGSGKTGFLHSLILSAAYHYSPDELEFYFIDFSGVTFAPFKKLPHTRYIVCNREIELGIALLKQIRKEVAKRIQLFNEVGVEDFRPYRTHKKLPRIILVIDELKDFFRNDTFKEEAKAMLIEAAEINRKYGINLFISAQDFQQDSLRQTQHFGMHIYLGKVNIEIEGNKLRDFTKKMPANTPGSGLYMIKESEEQSSIFQTFFTDKEQGETELLVEKLVEQKKCVGKYHPIIMDGKSEAYLENSETYKNITPQDQNNSLKIVLGEPIDFAEYGNDFSINLERRTSDNVFIVGGMREMAMRCLNAVVSSINKHYNPNTNSKFIFINLLDSRTEPYKTFNAICEKTPQQSKDFVKVLGLYKHIDDKIKQRKENTEQRANEIFCIIAGYESMPVDWKRPEAASLIKEASLYGIYFIIQADSIRNISNTETNAKSLLQSFNHRLILEISHVELLTITAFNTPRLFADGIFSSKRCYYYDEITKKLVKLKIFQNTKI